MSDNPFSYGRISRVVLPIIVVALLGYVWWSNQVQAKASSDMASNILSKMLGDEMPGHVHQLAYADADGDLLADAPPDADCVAPDPLVFCYIAGEEEGGRKEVWQELLDAISQKLGRKVEMTPFSKTDEQLAALKNGGLHITGFETGAVQAAVEQSGFVPVCTLGREDGSYGYTMKFVVRSASNIKDVAELRGKKVTFTRPTSNSGFKAPFVYLMEKHGLLPERDYDWSFSLGHADSIRLVADGKTDSAPVASDVLSKMVEEDQGLDATILTIYESERFPPAAIGYANNLKPEIREAIREVLLNFDWKGTGLESQFGPMGATKFVVVNYKDDWANTRRIDRAVDEVRDRKVSDALEGAKP